MEKKNKKNLKKKNVKVNQNIIKQKEKLKKNIKEVKEKVKIKKVSKIFIFYLLAMGLLMFLISILVFGFLISSALMLVYVVLVLFTLVLDTNYENSKKRKIVKFILTLGLIGCIFAVICFIAFFIFVAVKSPSFDIKKLNRNETTLIYDKDNKLVATLGSEKREKVSYNELPEVLVDAIIATEDSRYFQHNGFDAPRFLKATLKQIIGSSDAGGASTLTMQVAKNNFTSLEASGIEGIIRKFTDIYLSIFKIEKTFTKQEIIEFYVNAPYLGGYSYGVEQASLTYFNKHVKDINLAEASLIAGLFQAPSSYDPYVDPEAAAERRSTVLNLMVKHGYISQEEADIANSVKVESLLKNGTNSSSGNKYQGYLDQVIKETIDKTGYDPYVVPMKIYTNMDASKQDAIEKVFTGETYSWINDSIQGGAVAIDSTSGKILAIGAGRNRSGERTFSYATDIKRQVGSTAKPLFDYAPGIQFNNWSTGKIFNDVPWSYSGSSSRIVNYDGRYLGKITLRYSLADSRNVPAVQAFQSVDNAKIKDFVTKLGIEPEIQDGRIHEAHSLGAFNGASPLRMAAAYQAFSNGGYYYEPYSINKIIIRESGEEKIYKSEKVSAMDDSTAYMITDILKEVASSIGAVGTTSDSIAAKTGTTNYDTQTKNAYGYPSNATPDGWIVGYTPNMVISIWTGYTENTKGNYVTQNQMVTQRNGLFKACAKAAFNSTGAKWTKPSSVVAVTLEKGTELLASENTPANQKVTELFKRGTEPKKASTTYQKLENPTGLSADFADGTVKLIWNSVNKPTDSSYDKYGKFGYRIYLDGVELGFTTNNYYTYTTSNPYGTYTVKTSFSDITTNMSSGATYKIEANISFESNLLEEEIVTIGSAYDFPTTPVNVYEDGIDVTDFSTINKTIVDVATNIEVDTIDTSINNDYIITYTVTYKEKQEQFETKISVR